MIYEWLGHKMISRNMRLVRLGQNHRVWFIAFWVSFAALAATRQNWLKLTTLALLVCAVIARVLADAARCGSWRKRFKMSKSGATKENILDGYLTGEQSRPVGTARF